MKKEIYQCYKSGEPCSGFWGCKFLTAPPPDRKQTKEAVFVAVYKEAKQKEILNCPHFKAIQIDIALEQEV